MSIESNESLPLTQKPTLSKKFEEFFLVALTIYPLLGAIFFIFYNLLNDILNIMPVKTLQIESYLIIFFKFTILLSFIFMIILACGCYIWCFFDAMLICFSIFSIFISICCFFPKPLLCSGIAELVLGAVFFSKFQLLHHGFKNRVKEELKIIDEGLKFFFDPSSVGKPGP